jgi:Enoyl-CoA hydratase/isomerase
MAGEGAGLAAAPDAAALALREAAARLARPDAGESYGAAWGRPWVAVELAGDPPPPAQGEALRAALARLPCVTIAFVPEPGVPAARALADAFDVRAETRDDLERIVARSEANPLAATALVQLLRGHERRDVEQGLVAESFVYSTLQGGPEFAAWLARQPPARPEVPEHPPVRVARDGARLEIVLSRSTRRNAYSAGMRDALCEALQLAACDDAIQEVVLRGVGPAFCAGGDLDEFGRVPDPATAHLIRTTRSAARLLAALASRVRAELHGACIGAGIELPSFAHTVAAQPDAFFQLPELAMGLVPGAGGTVSLPRRIGRQRTAFLAITGTCIDRDTAARWGLVDEAR